MNKSTVADSVDLLKFPFTELSKRTQLQSQNEVRKSPHISAIKHTRRYLTSGIDSPRISSHVHLDKFIPMKLNLVSNGDVLDGLRWSCIDQHKFLTQNCGGWITYDANFPLIFYMTNTQGPNIFTMF